MQTTFTLRPTPNLKGCYQILCNGQVVSEGFGRADMKREFRAYQMGWKQVQLVEAEMTIGEALAAASRGELLPTSVSAKFRITQTT